MPLRLGHDDLVLSHFSLPLTTPFPDRVRAAAEAGFAGMGWYVLDYVNHLEQGWTDERIGNVLAEHDMVLHEVDALPLNRLALADQAVHLAITFGARNLQVQGDYPTTLEDAAKDVAVLADRVAAHDINISIEFVGNKNIASASDALRLADLSGRTNVGVQVDIWHHVRGADDWVMLEALPPERIVSVQFDDGPLLPVEDDYTRDTVLNRCPPGEGEMDVVRFLQTVHPASCALPLSLEVISAELFALPVAEAARRIHDATRRVQQRAGTLG
jgi:sugar phosphate isomerase/epimerase